MSDSLEITVEIDDIADVRQKIGKNPREFGVWMREALTSDSADHTRGIRFNLQADYGVRITATRRVFRAAQ